MLTLKKIPNSKPNKVLLVILDGVGVAPPDKKEGDAVSHANIPTLKKIWEQHPTLLLKAHGTAVGMPSDEDMGNSEVGHNVLGCGRVFDQGAKLVTNSIQSGSLFQGKVWKKLIQNCIQNQSTLHYIGLLSNGNVHSHIDHLFSLIQKSVEEGIRKLRVHILLDGRDVPEKSALEFVTPLEKLLQSLQEQGIDALIASGGGRMHITMDRYEADWGMVERGWKTHVLGEGRQFSSASQAIQTYRDENPNLVDQYIPSFVIAKDGVPVGKIHDKDSVIFFNFRGDRAIEISRAFTETNFNKFHRDYFPKVEYAGMMLYDGDLQIPPQYLVNPPAIDRTLSEYLVYAGLRQYALSETQKFGHVTYFWNGNRSGYFSEELETYQEIRSDIIPFDQKPEMKAYEITETLIQVLEQNSYNFYRVNFANGDMVGHTGNFQATVKAMETLDKCMEKIYKLCMDKEIILLVTADHGNADEMYQYDKNGNLILDKNGNPYPRTSHSLNPVYFSLVDSKKQYNLLSPEGWENPPGLANVAATILELLGYKAPPDYHPSLINKIQS